MPRGGERPICSVPECGRPHSGHSYCKEHLYRVQVHGDPNTVNVAGYGEMLAESFDRHGRRTPELAARIERIQNALATGRTYASIAREFGVSRQRVGLIAKKGGLTRRN